MNSIVEIASKVSTPLALGGLIAAFLFFIFRQILTKNIFPKLTAALSGTILQSIIDKLFILALVAMILGFAGYVVKVIAGMNIPPDSVSISIPSGMSLQDAAKIISADEGHTAVFLDCPDAFLNSKVESGTLTGRTSMELIETLEHRLIEPTAKHKYRVKHLKDKGIYEIHCNQ